MIDQYKLALLPRDRPLRILDGPQRTTTCVINGCPIDQHSYCVNLPHGAGKACLNCASDAGFSFSDN